MHDKLEGINVVTGDQANQTTLARWVAETGGSFDMIVDDGGHYNHQVMASYTALWQHLNPGGVYVMEDIHVCRSSRYATPWGRASGRNVPADFLQSIAARLLGEATTEPLKEGRTPPPTDADWVLCQAQACAIGKKAVVESSNETGRK